MSKHYTDGRQFSRRQVIEGKTPEELERIKAEWNEWKEPVPRSVDSYVTLFRNHAQEILDGAESPGPYERDSREDLAGRILQAIHELECGEDKVLAALELGMLVSLAHTYEITTSSQRKGGKRSKVKPWAVALARRFCKDFLSDKEIREELENDSEISIRVERRSVVVPPMVDDVIQPIDHDGRDYTPLKFISFIKQYVTPTRQKIY